MEYKTWYKCPIYGKKLFKISDNAEAHGRLFKISNNRVHGVIIKYKNCRNEIQVEIVPKEKTDKDLNSETN